MYKDLISITSHVTDVKAIKNSIQNILMTRIGSLPGKPRFGSDLYKLNFSQLDSLTIIMAKNFIFEALSEYEDRIIIQNIDITKVEEYNKLVINIIFTYRDEDKGLDSTSESLSLSLNY